MVTDSRQQRTVAVPQLDPGLLGRAAAQVRQFICGLHGHDALLHFEQGRISLQCTSCSYETPGWDIKGVPPRTEAAKAPRHLIRLPLVGERRVA